MIITGKGGNGHSVFLSHNYSYLSYDRIMEKTIHLITSTSSCNRSLYYSRNYPRSSPTIRNN